MFWLRKAFQASTIYLTRVALGVINHHFNDREGLAKLKASSCEMMPHSRGVLPAH